MLQNSFVFLYVTFKNQDQAQNICQQLLEEKLIACANIIPQMKSIYKWEGKTHQDLESAAILKTKSSLHKKLENRITELHSYQTPCIASVPVDSINDSYKSWLLSSLY